MNEAAKIRSPSRHANDQRQTQQKQQQQQRFTNQGHLSGRIQLVELDAQVGRVLPRVHRHSDLQGRKGDPLHDGAAEVAQGGDGLDRPLRENVEGKCLKKTIRGRAEIRRRRGERMKNSCERRNVYTTRYQRRQKRRFPGHNMAHDLVNASRCISKWVLHCCVSASHFISRAWRNKQQICTDCALTSWGAGRGGGGNG